MKKALTVLFIVLVSVSVFASSNFESFVGLDNSRLDLGAGVRFASKLYNKYTTSEDSIQVSAIANADVKLYSTEKYDFGLS